MPEVSQKPVQKEATVNGRRERRWRERRERRERG